MSKCKGAVSAGDKHTVEAGIEILKMGGNAFDALVASFFTACLSELPLTSPAGGGYVTYFDANNNEVKYCDFFVDVPEATSIDKKLFPVNVNFGATTQVFHIGSASTAVPGALKGILELHKQKGSIPLEECLKYPIKLAENGFYISKFISYVINDLLAAIFLSTPESKKLFTVNGNLLNDKVLYKNNIFASFLKQISKDKGNSFYFGEIANSIDSYYKENNGLLSSYDLKNYKTIIDIPLKVNFRDYEIYLPFKSSIGGMLLYLSLHLLKENASDNYLLDIINIIADTAKFRANFFTEKNLDKFLNISAEEYIKHILTFSKKNILGNTTHFSIVDKYHNAVSCTTSNGEGSGIVIENTGFMMNNMLGEEDLNPFGFFNWTNGNRLFSMMSPTIITKNNAFYLALGSAGSNRIRSAILNTIYNFFVKKMTLDKSINSPRIHFENNTVYIENGLERDLIQEIENSYSLVRFDEFNMFFGGVHAVGKDFAAADTRRNGYFKVIKG